MTISATTRRFRPSIGTDWVPSIEEVTSIVFDIGADRTPPDSDTRREHAEVLLDSLHDGGLVSVSAQLEAREGRAHLAIGSTAGAALGGSLNLATDAIRRFAAMWGSILPQAPWIRQTDLPAATGGDTIRFRRSPGLGVDWSAQRWSWDTIARTVAQAEAGTRMQISFLSTVDVNSPTPRTPEPDRPLPRLWATGLTMTAPHEISNTEAGRLTSSLFGLSPWKIVQWLDAEPDLTATTLGIPIVGGSRRRLPGNAITTSRVADLLGFKPIQLRLNQDSW